MAKTKKDRNILKVTQLENKNQFLIIGDGFYYFQSYSSLVAVYDENKQLLTLGCDFDYSNTTRKHLYIFINNYCAYKYSKIIENTRNKRQAILKAIKDGVIKYDENMH